MGRISRKRRAIGVGLLALILALSLGYLRWGTNIGGPPEKNSWASPVMAADPNPTQPVADDDQPAIDLQTAGIR